MSKVKKATEYIGLLAAILSAAAMGMRLRREIHASIQEALDTQAIDLDEFDIQGAVDRARKGME